MAPGATGPRRPWGPGTRGEPSVSGGSTGWRGQGEAWWEGEAWSAQEGGTAGRRPVCVEGNTGRVLHLLKGLRGSRDQHPRKCRVEWRNR